MVSIVLKCIRDIVTSKLNDSTSGVAPWMKLWSVWLNLSRAFGLQEDGRSCTTSQTILVEYFIVCLALVAKLHGKLKEDHVREFGQIAAIALSVPVKKDSSPFLVPSLSSESLSSLQFAIILCSASLYSTSKCSRSLSLSEGIEKTLHKVERVDVIKQNYPISSDPSVRDVHPVVMEALLGCIKQVIALLSSPSKVEEGSLVQVVHFGPFVHSALYHSLHLCESCQVTSIQSVSLFLKVCGDCVCIYSFIIFIALSIMF